MRYIYDDEIMQALTKLGADFPLLNWNFSPKEEYGTNDLVSHWLGKEQEDVTVCVFKGTHLNEEFHRQDFFFLHFAYKGDYDALSSKHNNRITVKENDCYIGQPYNGYAAKKNSGEETIIIAILIRKETFIQEFLSSFLIHRFLIFFWNLTKINMLMNLFIYPFPKTHLYGDFLA